jgi:hypothetical protein
MTLAHYILAFLALCAAASLIVWRKIISIDSTEEIVEPVATSTPATQPIPVVVVPPPQPVPVVVTETPTPVVATPKPVVNPDAGPLYWDTPKHIYHAVRVTCDLNKLSVTEKNILCACLYQESRFNNGAVNHNKNSAGVTLSTDYGLCQINDYYHIGPGKDFPSVAYVLENPDKVFEWMISMYKHGMLKQWVSYSSGAYKQWLKENSPMWKLGE